VYKRQMANCGCAVKNIFFASAPARTEPGNRERPGGEA
jgi:hypothetical protein